MGSETKAPFPSLRESLQGDYPSRTAQKIPAPNLTVTILGS